jgi:hypothetical protein
MEIDGRCALALPLALTAIRPAAAGTLDAVENRFAGIGDLRLAYGPLRPNARLAYETYGTLNAARRQHRADHPWLNQQPPRRRLLRAGQGTAWRGGGCAALVEPDNRAGQADRHR